MATQHKMEVPIQRVECPRAARPGAAPMEV